MRISRLACAAAALTTAVVGAGFASSAAPASADVPAGPIQYVTQSFWSGTASVPVTGTAHCPSGSRVVSSGASAPGGQVVGIAPDINFHDAATATARLQGYMQVTVGCEPFSAISEVTSKTIALPYASGFRRGVVYCPSGTRAFGGGGYIMKPSNILSTDTYKMVSNTVSADGTGWTFAATTTAKESLVVTTQCAPLRDSYISQGRTPAPYFINANVYAPCRPGYTALSGGEYLSKLDGNEVENGIIDYSVPASGNRWYTDGEAMETAPGGTTLVALAQCVR